MSPLQPAFETEMLKNFKQWNIFKPVLIASMDEDFLQESVFLFFVCLLKAASELVSPTILFIMYSFIETSFVKSSYLTLLVWSVLKLFECGGIVHEISDHP